METIKNTTPKIKHRLLGQTSQRYESGSNGPATVSSGRGDYGGVSYGTYQFSSRDGESSSVAKFVRQSAFANRFQGLMPGSREFSRSWQGTAAEFPYEFGMEQHDYIKVRYYDNAVAKLRRLGLNEATFCFGLKELIWSSSVQFGPSGCFNIFQRANITPAFSNIQIIEAVYKEKSRVRAYFRSSSESVQNGVLRRYHSERLQNLQDCA